MEKIKGNFGINPSDNNIEKRGINPNILKEGVNPNSIGNGINPNSSPNKDQESSRVSPPAQPMKENKSH